MSAIRRDTKILLVDCDAFYCSCERVFNPKLKHRPVIVLSNNDGIVVARSKETKALGIPMGAPRFQYDDLICRHDIAVLSSNYELYGDISRRVMGVLAQFSPLMEEYSIDEAFLSFPINQRPPCTLIGCEIQQRVKQCTGIPVTVGIGPTKTLAKVAVEFAKKNPEYGGVLDLSVPDCHINDFLDQLPVSDIWGVGRHYNELLVNNNIKTARELRDTSDDWIRHHMTVVGLRTVWELRGIQCLSLKLAPPKQSIICSGSFGRPIDSLIDLKEAVATHVTRGADKLRRQHSIAHSIQVFIETNRFKAEPQYSNAITLKLDQPTAYTPELVQVAMAGLERVFKPQFNYKRAGIMLLGICSQEQVQGGFWGRAYSDRDKKAMAVVDQINARFGKGTIKIAACCLTKEQKWQMRCDKRSPRYTTRWEELMVAKAGDIAKDLSTAALFWRDAAACCFTLLRYYTPEASLERAHRMATTLEKFSTLQLYSVIANEQIMPWQASRPAPPSGTEQRLRIAFYPSEPLNPSAGITNIRISVLGPIREIADIFTAKPPNFSHPFWKMLEKEIIAWLRLPNGLPVSSAIGAARIHYTKLYEISEELRSQPGRPPVDFAISDAVRKLDNARSSLRRAERNHLPLEYILARIEKYQRNLAFLQRLHLLEQTLWQQLQSPAIAAEPTPEEMTPINELMPIVSHTRYLPAISQPIPGQWCDIALADFENPNLWAPLGELRSKFKITSESTFWRTLARLKTMGLRTITARQDKRIRLYYRPEIDQIIAQPATASMSISTSKNSNINTKISNNPDQIWKAIEALQQQQQALIDALNNISEPINSNNPSPDNEPIVALEQPDKQGWKK
jgi:DNA polymerase V